MRGLFEIGKIFFCMGLAAGMLWALCNLPLWQCALAGIGIGVGCMATTACIVGIKIIWKTWREAKRYDS